MMLVLFSARKTVVEKCEGETWKYGFLGKFLGLYLVSGGFARVLAGLSTGGLPLVCQPVGMSLLFISDNQHIMPEEKVTFPSWRAPVTWRNDLIWDFSDVIDFI